MDKVWENQLYFIMEASGTIIIVCFFLFYFSRLYKEVLPANPGTLMGIGLGGCFGMIGVAFGTLGGVTGIALGGLLGGFIGSGMYQDKEREIDQQNEHPRDIAQWIKDANGAIGAPARGQKKHY